MNGRAGRIAIVAHSHPSVTKGGAEIAAYALFNGLRALGVEAVFIAVCPQDSAGRLALRSHAERVIFYDPHEYDHFYHLASPRVSAELHDILISEQVSVVNFHHYLSYGLGALKRVAADPRFKVFVTLHEYLAICHHHGQMITRPGHVLCAQASMERCGACYPEQSLQQFALRREKFLDVFRGVDGFISPSRFLAERYAAWGLPAGRIMVVENGLAHPPAPGPAVPRQRHSWVYGYFGQINPFKGVDVLLRALPLIAEDAAFAARVEIRVHGNFVGQPEAFTTRFNEAVEDYEFFTYQGAYENDGVGTLMAACDYVVMPSTWWENSPVVIQEAYGAGRPVVCSGLGGMAEKVPDRVSGLQFRRNDAADLVRVMTEAADRDLYAQLQAGIPPVWGPVDVARAYLGVFGVAQAYANPLAPG